MVLTKRTKLEKEKTKLKTSFCRRCGKKLTGTVRLRGFSVVCPRCRRPL